MKDTFRPELIGRNAALFIDYDGTLTPLTDDPLTAYPSPLAIKALQRLAKRCPLAIITGRHIGEIDRFLAPLKLPIAGLGGKEFRRMPASAILTSAEQPEENDGIGVINKGDAIARFMRLSPFRGKKPFFFADEGATHDHFGMDEYGFQKVACYGGQGVLVGQIKDHCTSSAKFQVPGPEEMVKLLTQIADQLDNSLLSLPLDLATAGRKHQSTRYNFF